MTAADAMELSRGATGRSPARRRPPAPGPSLPPAQDQTSSQRDDGGPETSAGEAAEGRREPLNPILFTPISMTGRPPATRDTLRIEARPS
jgi:hypothetical protein